MPLKIAQEYSPVQKIKFIIAIGAGKGGVGKSSVAVNLAHALKELGFSVGILDIDLYGPSIRKMLPDDKLPRQEGEILYPAESNGIKLMSMAYFRKTGEAAVIRAPIANSIVTQFLKDVSWGELDFLLVDCPPGTGDILITLSQQANIMGAVMVTTPQDVSVIDVRKAIHMFTQVKVPILGIVENMSYYHHKETDEKIYIFGKGGGARLAKEMNVPLLAEIPLDPGICRSGDSGEIHLHGPFWQLAHEVVSQMEKGLGAQMIKFKLQDPHHLVIKWVGQETRMVRVSDLQAECPCAACVDEVTGERFIHLSDIDPNLSVERIEKVGQYALRFAFSSGCSSGIYHFDTIKKLSKILLTESILS
jgi:ATP-binding protein involved in chromosome partitioning